MCIIKKTTEKGTTSIGAGLPSVGYPGGTQISSDYVIPNRDELMKAGGYFTVNDLKNGKTRNKQDFSAK